MTECIPFCVVIHHAPIGEGTLGPPAKINTVVKI